MSAAVLPAVEVIGGTHADVPHNLHVGCTRCGWLSHRFAPVPVGTSVEHFLKLFNKLRDHFPHGRCPKACQGSLVAHLKEDTLEIQRRARVAALDAAARETVREGA